MGNIGAAKKLHNNLLVNKLHTPQSFFDTTPIGRIINRFSKDIYIIDEALPATVLMLLGTVFVSLSTIIVIISSTPIFAVVIAPLAFIYLFVQVLGETFLMSDDPSCISFFFFFDSSSSWNGMPHATRCSNFFSFTFQFWLLFLYRLWCCSWRASGAVITSFSIIRFLCSLRSQNTSCPARSLLSHTPKHTHVEQHSQPQYAYNVGKLVQFKTWSWEHQLSEVILLRLHWSITLL